MLPELAAVGRVSRSSTSAGLFNQQTGAKLPGSNGLHVFLLVQDGADIERFLKSVHARCWLAGFGWLMVGAGGQLLERSIVDRMVGAPERLVFEGAPVLAPPLAQDPASRQPIVTPGTTLDTIAACPPLSIAERARLHDMLGKEAHRLAPAIARAREAFVARQSQQLAARTGMPAARAAHIIARQCSGILLPDVVLPFDDEELHGSTVADVLADPGKYEGATLADPLEGPEYGRCKAKIMRRSDGTPWINSFAHGRTVYQLRYDATAIAAALDKATPEEIAELFACLAVNADLAKDELENLRDRVAKTVGVGKRAIDGRLKAKRREHAQQESTHNENRRAAERLDPRPRIPAPEPDAPWLPQMQALNDVLGHSTDLEPPARDIDGVMVQVRVRRIPNMHALTQDGANDEEPEETRLPAPEQPLLSRMSEPQLAEMIERHIDFVAKDDRPVHLAGPFVHHFHSRTDDALPLMAAIATLPLVLGNGTILAKPGLDRDRGIVFRVPPELIAILPQKEDCTPQAVGEAMQFLADDWLCDVATTYEGKCTIIASTLSVIERSLLDNRPVFFISAGRRGGGKTTVLVMALVAATGIRPAAAAWSTNEEERRKALLAYLLEASAALIWDNIARGSQIACPHIERACTTEFYSDRPPRRLRTRRNSSIRDPVFHREQHRPARRPRLPRPARASRSRPSRPGKPQLQAPRPDRLDRSQPRQNPAGALHDHARQPRTPPRQQCRSADPLQNMVAPRRLRRRTRRTAARRAVQRAASRPSCRRTGRAAEHGLRRLQRCGLRHRRERRHSWQRSTAEADLLQRPVPRPGRRGRGWRRPRRRARRPGSAVAEWKAIQGGRRGRHGQRHERIPAEGQ